MCQVMHARPLACTETILFGQYLILRHTHDHAHSCHAATCPPSTSGPFVLRAATYIIDFNPSTGVHAIVRPALTADPSKDACSLQLLLTHGFLQSGVDMLLRSLIPELANNSRVQGPWCFSLPEPGIKCCTESRNSQSQLPSSVLAHQQSTQPVDTICACHCACGHAPPSFGAHPTL